MTGGIVKKVRDDLKKSCTMDLMDDDKNHGVVQKRGLDGYKNGAEKSGKNENQAKNRGYKNATKKAVAHPKKTSKKTGAKIIRFAKNVG